MMKTIFGNKEANFATKSTAVGLGNFDGLHIGHMTLINTLINEARLNGLTSVVYTFVKHPENILRKKLVTPLLTTVDKKIEILSETSLDYLYLDEFDEEFSRMEPERFFTEVLLERLGARLLVAGFDYSFGYMGKGKANLLKELGRKYGVKVIIIPPVKINNIIVSSTVIRDYIEKGDMEKVFKLLGRNYSITGQVMDGKMLGRKIGFPTANLHPEKYLALPCNGVYITKTRCGGQYYNSLTNVGRNPTFGGLPEVSIETHILDFDEDIYRSNIEVFFLKKLRNEKKFKDAEELIRQICRDIKAAKEYFGLDGA